MSCHGRIAPLFLQISTAMSWTKELLGLCQCRHSPGRVPGEIATWAVGSGDGSAAGRAVQLCRLAAGANTEGTIFGWNRSEKNTTASLGYLLMFNVFSLFFPLFSCQCFSIPLTWSYLAKTQMKPEKETSSFLTVKLCIGMVPIFAT